MNRPIEEAIEEERQRRLALRARRRPYHYWRVRGDTEPPAREFWCDYCAGYYGVPHNDSHEPGRLCRNMLWRPGGSRQCACIDCVTFEQEMLS